MTDRWAADVFRAASNGMYGMLQGGLLSRQSSNELRRVFSCHRNQMGYSVGSTPFIIAAQNGHNDVVRLFWTKYSDYIDIDGEGDQTLPTNSSEHQEYIYPSASALYCAAWMGHLDVVATL